MLPLRDSLSLSPMQKAQNVDTKWYKIQTLQHLSKSPICINREVLHCLTVQNINNKVMMMLRNNQQEFVKL